MKSTLELQGAWRGLIDGGTVGLVELDASHPFRRYYGLDPRRRPQLVFLSEQLPALPPVSDLILLERGQRESDKLWALSLTLADSRFTELFVHLGSHLASRSQDARSPEEGLAQVMLGLDEWRRLLKPRVRERLSEEQLRGVLGEVWIALNRPPRWLGSKRTVDAWVGPFGHPQDFVDAEMGALEVKSIREGAHTVKISSADQLDSASARLQLCVVTLVECGETDASRICLTELADELRTQDLATGGTGDAVDSRFDLIGVDLTDTYYGERFFLVKNVDTFDVVEGFPAIRASSLEHGLVGVRYEIDRAFLDTFASADPL